MFSSVTLTHPVTARDHVQGPADAPLTLVEYGDYQCPSCGAAHAVVQRLQQSLGNRLRFVFRNFPLTQLHPHALAAAEAAEAAALQGKFWEMHELLFEHQESLEPGSIHAWAEKLGLDLDKMNVDIGEGAIGGRLVENRQSGIRSGVNGTPTFFINGVRFDGPPEYDALMAALEAELAQQ